MKSILHIISFLFFYFLAPSIFSRILPFHTYINQLVAYGLYYTLPLVLCFMGPLYGARFLGSGTFYNSLRSDNLRKYYLLTINALLIVSGILFLLTQTLPFFRDVRDVLRREPQTVVQIKPCGYHRASGVNKYGEEIRVYDGGYKAFFIKKDLSAEPACTLLVLPRMKNVVNIISSQKNQNDLYK